MCTLMNIGFRVELNGRIELLVDDLKILLGKTLLKFRAREFALAAYKIQTEKKKECSQYFNFNKPLDHYWLLDDFHQQRAVKLFFGAKREADTRRREKNEFLISINT